jgi:outer membrane protein assembly factor BamE (lipoprotein component of BamABCDE complex)
MNASLARILPPALAAVVAAGLFPACIINVDSHSERSGRYVSASTLQQIEPGRTQEYVLALIGEPTSRTRLDGGTEIWKWAYSETKRSEGTLIFVFSGDDTSRTEGAAYVEFQDGVVRKTWQD